MLPEQHLATNMPRYTQAIMDLGATVCTARKPACAACPLHGQCRAEALSSPEAFPVKTRKLKRTAQTLWLLWAESEDGAVWLSQRPTPGVWAGLYCLPLLDDRDTLQAAVPAVLQSQLRDQCVVKHVLTHKDLYLHPVRVVLPRGLSPMVSGGWVESGHWPQLGLPAPIRKLLAT